MNKRVFSLLLACLVVVLLAVGCSRHKIIPDQELAQIFSEAFLTNAYISTQSVRLDSLQLYEPIFARYGYTADDLYYTLGNFSKRKSARLGDVVEAAIDLLEADGAYYNREVAILDTINNVARRAFTRTIYADSLIRVRTLRDTTRVQITLDSLRAGDYNITADYSVDSLDRNERLHGVVWLERADGTKTGTYNFSLRSDVRNEPFSRRVTADTLARKLVFRFLSFDRYDRPKTPLVTLRHLKIDHIPCAEEAVDSLYKQRLDIRIFADEFFSLRNSKDSL